MSGNYLRRLLIVATISGVIAFILKIIFVQIWQATGVAWAGAISYGLFFMLPACAIAYRAVNPIKGKA
jgi:hypothetical protein